MGRFYDILDFTLFEGVNKDGIAEFLKNASKKISSYKKGDIAIFQDSLCKSLSLLCQGTLLAKMTNAEGKEIVIEHLAACQDDERRGKGNSDRTSGGSGDIGTCIYLRNREQISCNTAGRG